MHGFKNDKIKNTFFTDTYKFKKFQDGVTYTVWRSMHEGRITG